MVGAVENIEPAASTATHSSSPCWCSGVDLLLVCAPCAGAGGVHGSSSVGSGFDDIEPPPGVSWKKSKAKKKQVGGGVARRHALFCRFYGLLCCLDALHMYTAAKGSAAAGLKADLGPRGMWWLGRPVSRLLSSHGGGGYVGDLCMVVHDQVGSSCALKLSAWPVSCAVVFVCCCVAVFR